MKLIFLLLFNANYLVFCSGRIRADVIRVEVIRKEKEWVRVAEDMTKLRRVAMDQLQRQYLELSAAVPRADQKWDTLEHLQNSFAMARRVSKDWSSIVTLIKNAFGTSSDYKTVTFAVKVDDLWTSAVRGMVRTQEVYNLNSEWLADARMEGSFPHTNLTAGDCFDIAVFYYKLQHQERSVEWLLAALERSHQDHSVSRERLLEYLHLAQCFKGDLRASAKTRLRLRREFPSYTPSAELLHNYSSSVDQSCSAIAEKLKTALSEDENTPVYVKNTNGLCRPELYKDPDDRRLRCRFLHYNKPHLRVAPFKMEELNLDPPLLKVYHVFYDREFQHLKSNYQHKTRMAKTGYEPSVPPYDDPFQDTQHNIWIDDYSSNRHWTSENSDPVAGKIAKRSAALVNLNPYKSEPTMLANYGLAGELKMHNDLGKEERLFNDDDTDADFVTLMYYLNDVPEGGFTVFPRINRAVKPEKGTALIWFNRYQDWTRLYAMKHSGCPVIRGTKWIVSKWYHVRWQTFPRCVPGRQHSFKYYYL